MKKRFCSMLALVLAVSMLCGCGRSDLLEVPKYPLSAATIKEQLEVQELDWTVEEKEAGEENATAYALYDAEGKLIAELDSSIDGEERYLCIKFMSEVDNEAGDKTVIETVDWVKIIACGTVLFGGFTDQYEPYSQFTKGKKGDTKTYKREDMTDEADRIYQTMTRWTNEYDGITCTIKWGRLEKAADDISLDKGKQELISITFRGYTVEK